ncbi:MAG: GTP-binding protein [Planctomycetota bacterium]|nr:GTP-binding protein [Planctomycetota bacterium]
MRFVLIGGFLGAGKTTTIARLAGYYQQQGLSVGIVTNDQAVDLVDTHSLRSMGFSVGEVAGACFCCHFNELTETVQRLSSDQQPDIILAEPVGSCTDLVATVVQPLLQLHPDQFQVAPYGVILKPSHGRKILAKDGGGGFSPKAAYIFTKQLEEADFILLNRIDQLSEQEADELEAMLKESYPGVPVLRISAREGIGIDALVELLDQKGAFGRRILELDYDIYAEGEAELGWLNASLEVQADELFELDGLLMGIIEQLRSQLAESGAETAHLKTIGMAQDGHGVANLVSSDSPAELSLPSDCRTRQVDLIINARVAMDPVELESQVHQAVTLVVEQLPARARFRQTQSFRPGRPVPTHRMTMP